MNYGPVKKLFEELLKSSRKVDRKQYTGVDVVNTIIENVVGILAKLSDSNADVASSLQEAEKLQAQLNELNSQKLGELGGAIRQTINGYSTGASWATEGIVINGLKVAIADAFTDDIQNKEEKETIKKRIIAQIQGKTLPEVVKDSIQRFIVTPIIEDLKKKEKKQTAEELPAVTTAKTIDAVRNLLAECQKEPTSNKKSKTLRDRLEKLTSMIELELAQDEQRLKSITTELSSFSKQVQHVMDKTIIDKADIEELMPSIDQKRQLLNLPENFVRQLATAIAPQPEKPPEQTSSDASKKEGWVEWGMGWGKWGAKKLLTPITYPVSWALGSAASPKQPASPNQPDSNELLQQLQVAIANKSSEIQGQLKKNTEEIEKTLSEIKEIEKKLQEHEVVLPPEEQPRPSTTEHEKVLPPEEQPSPSLLSKSPIAAATEHEEVLPPEEQPRPSTTEHEKQNVDKLLSDLRAELDSLEKQLDTYYKSREISLFNKIINTITQGVFFKTSAADYDEYHNTKNAIYDQRKILSSLGSAELKPAAALAAKGETLKNTINSIGKSASGENKHWYQSNKSNQEASSTNAGSDESKKPQPT